MTAHHSPGPWWRRTVMVGLALWWCLLAGAWTSVRPDQGSVSVGTPVTAEPQPQGAPSPSTASASSRDSVLDGVYTSRQASSGERTFRQSCAACHDTREFSGARFRLRWSGQSVGDMFDIVTTLMPEDNPGSLTPEQSADVVAYFLSLNEYPVGDQPLPADLSALRTVQIEEPTAR